MDVIIIIGTKLIYCGDIDIVQQSSTNQNAPRRAAADCWRPQLCRLLPVRWMLRTSWGSQDSGQDDGDAMEVRGGAQGSSYLSPDMNMFQYFDNWYSCMNNYRVNMGLQQVSLHF